MTDDIDARRQRSVILPLERLENRRADAEGRRSHGDRDPSLLPCQAKSVADAWRECSRSRERCFAGRRVMPLRSHSSGTLPYSLAPGSPDSSVGPASDVSCAILSRLTIRAFEPSKAPM